MTIAYFIEHDKIINAETVTYAEVVGRTDWTPDAHVAVHFVGGDVLEFPPGVTLREVYTHLTEKEL